jgi:glycosyltransferase involved in cell wall biosynthesis
MADLLIITHEHIGSRMAGPGIRAWEIARALARAGFEVLLATPYPETSGEGNLSVVGFTWEDLASLKQWLGSARTVMATGPVLSRVVHWLRKPLDQPTIVDLYYVPEIEIVLLSFSQGTPFLIDLFIEETLTYLRCGDFFLYATERQRDFWLGALWMAGRLNERTLAVDPERWMAWVPMGIPDDPPRGGKRVLKGVIPGIQPEDKVVLWMGGIWEWTDPMSLGEAMEHVLRRHPEVRLVFGAAQHYDERVVPPMSRAAQFLRWCQERDWLGRYVFFLDWVPYEQRGLYLLEADIGVSLHDHPLESRYAVRARSLDYLWASLPCVLSAGDELADLLQAYGLARVVPTRDPRAVAEALLSWLEESPSREQLSQRTLPLRDRLRWSAVIRPIEAFLRDPQFAPDASFARERVDYWIGLRIENDHLRMENMGLRAENDRLRMENIGLREYLEAARRGRIIRVLNRIYRIGGRTFL